MSFSGFNLSNEEDKSIISSRKNYKVSIVVSEWNKHITSKLLDGAVETLTHHGILTKNIFMTRVPGSFELIFEAKKNRKNQNLIQ